MPVGQQRRIKLNHDWRDAFKVGLVRLNRGTDVAQVLIGLRTTISHAAAGLRGSVRLDLDPSRPCFVATRNRQLQHALLQVCIDL